jgi:hypothetical protein
MWLKCMIFENVRTGQIIKHIHELETKK